MSIERFAITAAHQKKDEHKLNKTKVSFLAPEYVCPQSCGALNRHNVYTSAGSGGLRESRINGL